MFRSVFNTSKTTPASNRLRPIPLKELGYQPPVDLTRTGPSQSVDPLNDYRNNLCCYSQVYNLFFVACASQILVYEPKYPDQILPEVSLYIDPPVTQPPRRGSLPGDPHAINHLLVAKLGDYEIVLCACDDGDVYAYYVRQIHESVSKANKQQPSRSEELYQDPILRPFFHNNVGISAWGLAVHEQARLIAVSCNSHRIYVYAFALVPDEPPSEPAFVSMMEKPNPNHVCPHEDASGIHWHCLQKPADFHVRRRNLLVMLTGHQRNIPSIAFCNTPEDQKGLHLISTDIAGVSVMWNVAEQTPVMCLRPPDDAWVHYDELNPGLRWAGWALLWVDRRAFAKVSDVSEALGRHRSIDASHGERIIEVTQNKHLVRNTGKWDNEVSQHSRQRRHTSSMDTSTTDGSATYQISNESSDSEESGDRSSMQADQGVAGVGNGRCMMTPYSMRLNGSYPALQAVPLSPFILAHGKHINLFQPITNEVNAIIKNSPRPISESGDKLRHSPIIHMSDPLEQDVDNYLLRRTGGYDRIYLQAQIPELGVIVLGSQKGRVAILTLHQLGPGVYNRSMKPIYTFRLNHILPLNSQEKRGERPDFPLVGLSASPMQGTEARPDGTRRYRIALVYSNRAMLTYEIGRDHGASDVRNNDELMI